MHIVYDGGSTTTTFENTEKYLYVRLRSDLVYVTNLR
jgi:hypothetical protein